MKKIWWLNIYTIPSLLHLVRWGVLILLADIAFTQVIAEMLGLEKGIGLGVYIVLLFKMLTQCTKVTLAEHLSFHKTHINSEDINKALLYDAGIFSAGSLFILYLCLLFSSFFGGALSDETSIFANIAFHAPSVLILIFFMSFGFLFSGRINDMNVFKTYYESLTVWEKIKNFVLTMFILMGGSTLVTFVIFSVERMSVFTILIILGITLLIVMSLDRRLALLHLRKINHSFKAKIKYTVPALALSLIFVYSVSFLSAYDLSNKKLSPDSKIIVLNTWSVFSPELSLETFQEVAPISDLLSASLIYNKSKKSIEGVPIEILFSEITPSSTMLYLIYGKPEERDYRYISEYVIKNIESWKKFKHIDGIISVVNKKCKTCWGSDFDKQLITEKTNFKWPKNITIDKREIASDPKEDEAIN